MAEPVTYKVLIATCRGCGIQKRIMPIQLNDARFNKCPDCRIKYDIVKKEIELDVETLIRDREREAKGQLRREWLKNAR